MAKQKFKDKSPKPIENEGEFNPSLVLLLFIITFLFITDQEKKKGK